MQQFNEIPDQGRNSSFKIGDKTNDPYISPTPGHLPIVAWSPIPRDFGFLLDCDQTEVCQYPNVYNEPSEFECLLKEIASSLKESGFNTILLMGSYRGCEGMMEAALNTKDENDKPLDIASIFVTLPMYRNSFAAMDAMIEHFETKVFPEGKPYPKAFLIQDEPQFNDWSQAVFGLQYKDTKDYVKDYEWNTFTVPCIYFKQWREKWMFFANLGGSGVKYDFINKKWQLSQEPDGYRSLFSANANNQEQYLQAMQLLFHPGVWCYDQYPFAIIYNEEDVSKNPPITFEDTTIAQNIKAGNNLQYLTIRSQEFYHFLECFNKISKETNRPFWSFLCTCGEGSWNGELQRYDSFLPTPTIGMLRFEAFNALALGAQGLLCFLYGMGWSNRFLNKNEDNAVYADAPMQATIVVEPGKPDWPDNPINPEDVTVTLHYKDNPLWQNVKTVLNEVRSLEKVFLNTQVLTFGHCFPGDNVPQHYLGLRTVSFASGTPTGFKPIQNVTFLGPVYPAYKPDEHPFPYPHHGVLISMLRTKTNEDTMEPIEPDQFEETSIPSDAEKTLSGLRNPGAEIDPSVTKNYIVITNHDAFNSQQIQISFLPGYRIDTVFSNFKMDAEKPNPPVVPIEHIDVSGNIISQSDDSDSSSGVTEYFSLLPGSMHIFKFTRLP